eukprot:5594355-Pleurochrysis_carterae.AAC.1
MKKITNFEVREAQPKTRHKFEAFFEFDDGTKKTTRFGDRAYEDYTMHGDKDRRERYWSRHVKDLRTNDPTRAGYLSLFILWGSETDIHRAISTYRRRLHEFNKTGEFPTDI